MFLEFVISFSSLLVFTSLISAWIFKSSSAPFWVKIMVPLMMTIIACYVPFSIKNMMGYPVNIDEKDLPDNSEIISFIPHDYDGNVDLWLISKDQPPRSYNVKLSPSLKQALLSAQNAKGQGKRVYLDLKGNGKDKGDIKSIGNDDSGVHVTIKSLQSKD